MSMEDPFFVVKGEVQKAVNAAQSLHHRWSELMVEGGGASKEEIDWTTNELRNSLRSIEWDLEDLDETISIVESNPKKFNLDAAELSKRKAFINSMRVAVKEMKAQMSIPPAASDRKNKQALLGERGAQGPIWQPGADKYSRLDHQLQNANSQIIEEQQVQQQLIAEQQDEQLELVSGTIGVLKNMSERIGMELDEQAVSSSVVCHRRAAYHPLHHHSPFLYTLINASTYRHEILIPFTGLHLYSTEHSLDCAELYLDSNGLFLLIGSEQHFWFLECLTVRTTSEVKGHVWCGFDWLFFLFKTENNKFHSSLMWTYSAPLHSSFA
uniref:t-SNARE coiled-coil homology domain-containing protein n=1 Tax=Astatotilapia calliptera TaxID=8154 RepID=A0A3P8QHQ3_ASTCA